MGMYVIYFPQFQCNTTAVNMYSCTHAFVMFTLFMIKIIFKYINNNNI